MDPKRENDLANGSKRGRRLETRTEGRLMGETTGRTDEEEGRILEKERIPGHDEESPSDESVST